MITIRLLDAADAAQFKSVRLRAIDTSPTSFLPTHAEEVVVPLEAFAARIAPTHERAVFGAFDGESLIGTTGVYRDARAKVAHKATIWGVFVDAAYRGRGVAQTLLDSASAHASQAWQCAQLMRQRDQRRCAAVVRVARIRAVRHGAALAVRRRPLLRRTPYGQDPRVMRSRAHETPPTGRISADR
jgi:ribosomal protein S18 acetylase RimI-like enzyme